MSWMKYSGMVLLFGLATGCELSDPGNSCRERTESFSLTQPTPGGKSGAEFFKGVVGVHEVTLSKPVFETEDDEKTDPKVTTSEIPANTPAKIEIEFPPNSSVSYIFSEYVPCKPLRTCSLAGVICHNEYAVPVRARVYDAEGRIDETWEGTLTALDPTHVGPDTSPVPPGGEVTLALTRPASSFQGAFKISAPQIPAGKEPKEHEITLSLQFERGQFKSGQISSRASFGSATEKVVSFGAHDGPILKISPK